MSNDSRRNVLRLQKNLQRNRRLALLQHPSETPDNDPPEITKTEVDTPEKKV